MIMGANRKLRVVTASGQVAAWLATMRADGGDGTSLLGTGDASALVAGEDDES
jgi:hypothetical protein